MGYSPIFLEDYLGYSDFFRGYIPEENDAILCRLGLSFSTSWNYNIETLEDRYFNSGKMGNLYYRTYPLTENKPFKFKRYSRVVTDGLYSMINYDSSFCNSLSDIAYRINTHNYFTSTLQEMNIFDEKVQHVKRHYNPEKISAVNPRSPVQLKLIFDKY